MKFEPGTRIGPYQILGELGRGGMATVFRAYQPNLEREVAIKILPEFLVDQPGFKARFHREAVAVAKLQHPNILSVFDHGEENGVTFIVSEYVEGGTLASRMGAPIQLDYCVRILRPIADALDYAHSEGVIHRDVKPSNILLDRRGVPILSDFGLARVAEGETERLTQTGAMVGTPTYMAPEQCSGGDVGAPADIYALAVIAFEMVTGRVPFTAPNPLGVIAAHQVTPPPPPRKFNPSLPASIEAPLLAGLAKDPARRPETATDFVEALAAAIPSGASQYPMTPAPMPPSPSVAQTAIEPPPSGSYGPVPAPPVSEPPPPAYPAPTGYPGQSSYPGHATPPPSSPQYTPAPVPYIAPAPAPYATAAATPPPSYPGAMVQPPAQYPAAPSQPVYSQPPMYGSQQWAGVPPPARAGSPSWMPIALWVGVGVAAIVALVAIAAPFNASMGDSTRWVWIALGVLAAVGTGAALASVLVMGRSGSDRGMRLGSGAVAGALLLLLLAGTNAYGFIQKGSNPSPQQSPTATACDVLTADKPLTPQAIGTSCATFAYKSTLVQLDCRSVSALPGPIEATSYDNNVSASGGGGTFSMDSAGCHFNMPAHLVEEDLSTTSKVDPSAVLLVADFIPPTTPNIDIGMSYGCDDTGCVSTDLYTVDSSVYIGEDSNSKLVSQQVNAKEGTNRLVLVIQGEKIRGWFNGSPIATQTGGRTHGQGYYGFWVTNYDKTQAVSAVLLRFAAYRLVS